MQSKGLQCNSDNTNLLLTVPRCSRRWPFQGFTSISSSFLCPVFVRKGWLPSAGCALMICRRQSLFLFSLEGFHHYTWVVRCIPYSSSFLFFGNDGRHRQIAVKNGPRAVPFSGLSLSCRLSFFRQVLRANVAAENDKVVCFKTFDDLKAEFPVTKATTKVCTSGGGHD